MSMDKDYAQQVLDLALEELAAEGERWSLNGYMLTPDNSFGWSTTLVNLDTNKTIPLEFTFQLDGVKAVMDRRTIEHIKQRVREANAAAN